MSLEFLAMSPRISVMSPRISVISHPYLGDVLPHLGLALVEPRDVATNLCKLALHVSLEAGEAFRKLQQFLG